MPHSLDHLLPSLQSLGLWSYWIIGLASMLEAFFVTGIIAPGTLVVDAAGILAQRGYVDFFDLVWFVAIGSVIGGELSFRVGRWGGNRLFARFDPESSRTFRRARDLFERHGGLALVMGRFLGPVAGFVPLAAALAGMEPRRFRIWNAVGSLPYALAHLALGYFFGDVLTRIGPMTTRIMLFAAGAAAVLAVLVYLVLRIERHLPALLSIGGAYLDAMGRSAPVQSWRARHPRLAAFLAARIDRRHVSGLPATLIALAFLYVLMVYVGTVFDFLMVPSVVRMDHNVAALMHVFRDPLLIHLAAYVTAFGIWQAVSIVLVAAAASLIMTGRWPLAAGLVAAISGNVVTVALLKLAFHRARPELAYFVETSGSFPSGHAAISVACYGTLAYIAWRARLVGPIVATLLGLIAAFLIGLSRLYLIEHYLSDVLNGYLVGAMWMLIGVSVAEWLQARENGAYPPAVRWRRVAAMVLWVPALAGCVAVSASYHKALTPPPPNRQSVEVTDLANFFGTTGAPATVQSIDGTLLAPINLILLAPDRAALVKALADAKIAPAGAASLSNILHAALSELFDKPDPSAPAMPAFWNDTPNAMIFVVPGQPGRDGMRHLLRIWPTRWKGPGGRIVFVASASFDDAQPWQAAQRQDPNVDAEREELANALTRAGVASRDGQAALPATTARHRPWKTDGKAAILTLR